MVTKVIIVMIIIRDKMVLVIMVEIIIMVEDKQDRHVNLTFQVTSVGQLSQFLRCFRPHTNTFLATKSGVSSLQNRDKRKEGVFLLSGGCICMSSSQIRGVVNAYPLYPGQKKTYITTTNS